jgi:predicted phage terminase large subunit-like protein
MHHNGVGVGSRCYIEPKASGKSTKQMLNSVTNIPAIEIDNYLVNEGKEARINVASPYFESKKIELLIGHWNENYKDQLKKFPKAKHDEAVDLTGYCVFHYFKPNMMKIFDSLIHSDNLL